MDSSKLVFIGGIATAALAGVYILLGPNHQVNRKKKAWVNGLANLGNTCFLNSVLQALAPCSSITGWVTKQNFGSTVLTTALADALQGLNSTTTSTTTTTTTTPSSSVSCPSEVLSALRQRNWIITNHEQDAHELFHALTTTLQEELIIQQSPLSLLDVHKIEENPKQGLPGVASRVCGSLLPDTATSFGHLVLPTKGLIACRLVCKTCGFRNAVRYDSFDSISLTLPEHFWGGLKLDQCLKQWASAELIPDVICAGCSKKTHGIKQRSTFIKQLCFGRLPSCLCLHLMRSVWLPMGGTPCKRYEHVSFPEYLSLGDYVAQLGRHKPTELQKFHSGLLGGTSHGNQPINASVRSTDVLSSFASSANTKNSSATVQTKSSSFSHLYQLKSVIVHLGDTFSGHFITYRRGPGSGQKSSWFCVSDMSVRQVSYADVFKASAYMLFYEKI